MLIAVTSTSKIKLDAVKNAYLLEGIEVTVSGFTTDSGVGEAPVNDKTLEGARNRIKDLEERVLDFDYVVSIESGIFLEDGQWLDRGVVVIFNPKTKEEIIGYSEPVIIPNEYVQQAKEIGFDKITIGQVMQKAGVVTNHADPHVSITGIPRQQYLEDAVVGLIKKVADES